MSGRWTELRLAARPRISRWNCQPDNGSHGLARQADPLRSTVWHSVGGNVKRFASRLTSPARLDRWLVRQTDRSGDHLSARICELSTGPEGAYRRYCGDYEVHHAACNHVCTERERGHDPLRSHDRPRTVPMRAPSRARPLAVAAKERSTTSPW